MSINETLNQIEHTSDWRREKAKQFPDDTRNSAAADLLDKLAEEVEALNGSGVERRIDALWDQCRQLGDNAGFNIFTELNEQVSVQLRDVGFRGGCESGTTFLEWYCETFEDLLRLSINDDDSEVLARAREALKNFGNDPTRAAVALARLARDDTPLREALCEIYLRQLLIEPPEGVGLQGA
jgi:hypothetical protein